MIIDWSVEKITHELRKCNRAMHDKYATGFETWGCKQDLYRVKFMLDEMLDEAYLCWRTRVAQRNGKGKSMANAKQKVKHPDPVKHKNISFAKSAIRIVAGLFLMSGQVWWAGAGFVVAELLGVYEEMV